MDHSALNRSSLRRTTSRTRRLIRFRTTAPPKARGVVKPILGPVAASPGSRRQKAENGPQLKRMPLS